MANEPLQGARYPVLADAPDAEKAFSEALADVVPRTNMRFATTAARDAAVPSPVEGMEAFTGTGTSGAKWVYRGGGWREVTVGQQIQHGRLTVDVSSLAANAIGPSVPVTFPKAFLSAPEVIVQTTQANTPTVFNVWSTSNTGFSVAPRNPSNAALPASTTIVVHWIAVSG